MFSPGGHWRTTDKTLLSIATWREETTYQIVHSSSPDNKSRQDAYNHNFRADVTFAAVREDRSVELCCDGFEYPERTDVPCGADVCPWKWPKHLHGFVRRRSPLAIRRGSTRRAGCLPTPSLMFFPHLGERRSRTIVHASLQTRDRPGGEYSGSLQNGNEGRLEKARFQCRTTRVYSGPGNRWMLAN
jgi:hypothetical protein